MSTAGGPRIALRLRAIGSLLAVYCFTCADPVQVNGGVRHSA